jgi:VCBS repeat protein/FG-GAP repeat protein
MRLSNLATLIVLAGTAAAPTHAQILATFLEPRHFGKGLAQAIAIADFNGDGIPDGATIGSDLSVYLGTGDGSFREQTPIGISGSAIVTADFNGDGYPDLAVAAGATLVVLLGNGNGTFRAPVSYPALAAFIALGDFNGDGSTDIAVYGQPGGDVNGQVQVFFGSPAGTFAPGPVTSTIPSGIPLAIVSADFNADGKADLALTCAIYHEIGEVVVLSGNGDGTFGSPAAYPDATASYLDALVTADFNGDGAPDLAYVSNAAEVVVLLNNGAGMFTPLTPIKLAATAISLAAADLNGDGILDLLAAGAGIGTVLRGSGNGAFREAGQYVLAYESTALAIADFNGDGIPDVAATNGTNSEAAPPVQPPLSLMLGSGQGGFESSRAFEASAAPNGIAVGDFNRDGNLDLAVSNYSPSVHGASSISVQLGDGHGGLGKAINYPAAKPTAIAVSDVNPDGKPDVVFVGHNCVGVLLGNGEGAFSPASYSPCPDCGGVLLVADFNGDGKPDLATADLNQGGVAILLGNGDGTFQPPVSYGAINPASLAGADFNGDGYLDLVASVAGSAGGTYILMGNGDGTFGAPVLLNGAGQFAVTGDFNGDGNADIAMLLKNGNGVAIYLGNGKGSFSPAFTVEAAVGAPLLSADFNSDGVTDLFAPAASEVANVDGLSTILLGNGNGDFSIDPHRYLIDASNGVYAAVGDFNNDGKPDLATTGYGNTVWIILNNTRH